MKDVDASSAAYLAATPVIDWQHPAVAGQARALAQGQTGPLAIAAACYRWVRDTIGHAVDIGAQRPSCRASEVLAEGQGLCFAKSHLLAALLRANGIPCGFDYQRLRDGTGFVLHGLNVIWLQEFGWYRVDARGNKAGVSAHFAPPREYLAWPVTQSGEIDYLLNLTEPLPEVVAVLGQAPTLAEALARLPTAIRMG